MKKIIAILLVITLMSALFVVPAHAHEVEETATPYALACPRCGSNLITKTTDVDENTVWDQTVQGCTNNPMTHLHGYYYRYTYYDCSACDYTRNISSTKITVCQYD